MPLVFPRADSDSRQERIMSEWAITNIIRVLSGKYNGTFRVSEDGKQFCLYGYYCDVSDKEKNKNYYLPVEFKEGWFQVAGDLQSDKPNGKEGEDYFSIDLDPASDGYAPYLNYLNSDYMPYIVSASEPQDPADRKKIWINPENHYIQSIYDETSASWVKLGAVYK